MIERCPECKSRNLFFHGDCPRDEFCTWHRAHIATCNDCKVLSEIPNRRRQSQPTTKEREG